MFEWYYEWRRSVHRRPILRWKHNVVSTLVNQIFSPETPFQYETALSFLQRGPFDPENPARVDLFLPEHPLAVDLLGPESRPQYREADRYLSRSQWEYRQEQLALKRTVFGQFNCPYLVVWYDEAVDPISLTERIRNLTGILPR